MQNEEARLAGLVVLASAALWSGSVSLSNEYLHFLSHAPGIDVVFIPSGLRLIALLIGGGWAALGISLGSLLLTGHEFGISSGPKILAIAAVSGFGPYLALRATLRLVGVDPGLRTLTPLTLPVIGLGVAAGSALIHNVVFAALGLLPWASFSGNVVAMAAGDFSGTLLAVVLVFLVLRIIRRTVQ